MSVVNKYTNGKIYKIVDVVYTKCYIGSTTEPTLARRMAKHRGDYTHCQHVGETKGRVSSFSLFDEFGVGNCKIELIEVYPCNSKDELLSREGYHVRNTECVNKTIPGRTRPEYRREYYAKNKEAILAQTKHYKLDNKEIVDERNLVYYVNNREAIQEKRCVKSICPCGGSYQAAHRTQHFRTTKHKTLADTTA